MKKNEIYLKNKKKHKKKYGRNDTAINLQGGRNRSNFFPRDDTDVVAGAEDNGRLMMMAMM